MKIMSGSIKEKKTGCYPGRIYSFIVVGKFPTWKALVKAITENNEDLDKRTIRFHDDIYDPHENDTFGNKVVFLEYLDEETRKDW